MKYRGQQSQIVAALQDLRKEARVAKLESEKFMDLMLEVKPGQRNFAPTLDTWRQQAPENAPMSTFIPQLSALIKEGDTVRVNLAVLFSLQFNTIHVRDFDIAMAHKKTFKWIYGEQEASCRIYFSEWLREGDGIFWISGKPGSGKSTLCKYIVSTSQTENLLRNWSKPKPLYTASYFFWKAGNDLQTSLEGLLRTILYDILRKSPDLIPDIFPLRWQQAQYSTRDASPWTKGELLEGLECLLGHRMSARFFLVIDGLDEYAGDPSDVVQLLRNLSLSPDVKICLSSRPWNIFQDAFGDRSKMLKLQDLTRNDIIRYVSDNLESSLHFTSLQKVDDSYQGLIEGIAAKAEGVFLWVYLVVKSFLQGLTDGDTIGDLQVRLSQLPSDLEEYFRHIVDSVEKMHVKSSARTLKLCTLARAPLPLLCFTLSDECDIDALQGLDIHWSQEKVKAKNVFTIRRLNARCRGLVEVRCSQDTLSERCVVEFLHRTVRDFLENEKTDSYLRPKAGEDFFPYTALMQIWIGFLRLVKDANLSTIGNRQIRGWIENAVYYANKVSKERRLTIESHNKNLDHIGLQLYSFVETVYPFELDYTGLMYQTIGSGLCTFVKKTIENREGIDRRSENSIKNDLPLFLSVALGNYTGRHEFRLEMVQLILEKGVHPNTVVCVSSASEPLHIWKDFFRKVKAGWDSWPPAQQETAKAIVIELIKHGADTDVDLDVLSKVLGVEKETLEAPAKQQRSKSLRLSFRAWKNRKSPRS